MTRITVITLLSMIIFLSLSSKAKTSPGLTLLEKDMLCICRHFNKKNDSSTGGDGSDEFCEKIGFQHRWESMFPGRVELGIGIGGLRGLAFKSKLGDQSNVVFAFREFEHDKLDYHIDDDAVQQFAMFGDEYQPTSSIPFVDALRGGLVRKIVQHGRHLLGFDYHKHACAFVDEVLSRGKVRRKPLFTGVGFGGAIAMLQGLRLETSTGITFSAHGVGKVADFYGYPASTKRLTNLVLDTDTLLGKPATKTCVFQAPDLYRLTAGRSGVYSPHGFVEVDSIRDCVDP